MGEPRRNGERPAPVCFVTDEASLYVNPPPLDPSWLCPPPSLWRYTGRRWRDQGCRSRVSRLPCSSCCTYRVLLHSCRLRVPQMATLEGTRPQYHPLLLGPPLPNLYLMESKARGRNRVKQWPFPETNCRRTTCLVKINRGGMKKFNRLGGPTFVFPSATLPHGFGLVIAFKFWRSRGPLLAIETNLWWRWGWMEIWDGHGNCYVVTMEK